MKKFLAVVLVVMAFLLAGCKGKSEDLTASEPQIEASQFIGNWEFVDSGDYQKVSFYENGTYRQITKVSGIEIDHTDNFVISENRLVLYYEEMGITYTYRVVFDTPDKMSFYNGGNDEYIITYKRK